MLLEIVAAHKRGEPVGIHSICSAHPFVLEAAGQQALADGSPLLVESTSNQVNQEGGYTGMTPADFHAYLLGIADRFGFPRDRLILGGDHLGPYPWRHQPAETAMAMARALVRDCVLAGYTKLHLDASMPCAGDPPDLPLDRALAADRIADLCQAAEEVAHRPLPFYVIGAEVPLPGGARRSNEKPAVTTVEDARETTELTRQAFRRRGLDAAWERVVALVIQPGVEFGDDALFEYDRLAVAPLSRFIEAYDGLVCEVHSTDYQPRDALKRLVEDHFAILKVGPALTFAFREAVFALAMIEAEWLPGREGIEPSQIRQVLDSAMLGRPAYWQDYYAGSEPHLRFARRYSLSDRSRYYWPDPSVQESLARLLANLSEQPIPLTLLSQFLPVQYERVRSGLVPNVPRDLIVDRIRSVLADYAYACGYHTGPDGRGSATATMGRG